MAYSYIATLTVASSQVTGTLTNFPALVSNTFDGTGGIPDLRIVGSGGKIQNEDTSGTPASKPADFAFYSDSGLTTILDFEIEYWNKTTGQLVAWVRVPSIATSTVIYMGYGDVAITTALDDATNVWDSHFVGVYHFPDGSSLGVNDSTQYGRHATNNSATATTGQIDGGAAFASSAWMSSTIDLSAGNKYTAELWLNKSSFANDDALGLEFNSGGSTQQWAFDPNASAANIAVFSADALTTANYATWTRPATGWQSYAITEDRSVAPGAPFALNLYIAGGLQTATRIFDSVASGNFASKTLYFMCRAGSSLFTTGTLDEVRISDSIRSAAWLLATYNNHNAPTTFWTQGSEGAVGGGGTTSKAGSLPLTGVQ